MNGKAALTERFLSFSYPVTLRKLSPAEGGGYAATIPQLGSGAFAAVGETAAEALASLEDLRLELIPRLIERGVDLPEPEAEAVSLDEYSGNVGLRLPRSLHARLAAEARRNGCSINKLATDLLSRRLERAAILREVRALVEEREQWVSAPRAHRWLSQAFAVNETPDPMAIGDSYERAA